MKKNIYIPFQPLDCGDPSPTNGIADTTPDTSYDATADITCDSGYTLIGSSTLRCTDIGWNVTTTCEIKGTPCVIIYYIP